MPIVAELSRVPASISISDLLVCPSGQGKGGGRGGGVLLLLWSPLVRFLRPVGIMTNPDCQKRCLILMLDSALCC